MNQDDLDVLIEAMGLLNALPDELEISIVIKDGDEEYICERNLANKKDFEETRH